MGLLDEAIREHLALKRGRGADPAEIARQEKEALGPPTRAEPPAPEDRAESEDAALDEPATASAPGDDVRQAGREPSEPRLRLADEPSGREEPPEPDEPHPAPEGRGYPPAGGPPPAEPQLRVTEDELRERMPEAGAPPPPPPPPPPSVAPVDDASAIHEEPVAPQPPPADLDAPLELVGDEPLDAPLGLVDDEPHTDDFVFDDEDDDFFADEFDESDTGEGEAAGPLPEAPPESPRYVAEPEPHGDPLIDDPAAGPLDQPTQQYALEDVEDATRPPEPPPPEPPPPEPPPPVPEAGEEDEPEGEELLEETPEFLEETPEHDRLWFEQKPPRDFDF